MRVTGRVAGIITFVTVVAALIASRPAHADDTWAEIARSDETATPQREYAREMQDGDDALNRAVAERSFAAHRRNYVERAVLAYERAAQAQPAAAEPHFRAASALYAFFVECSGEPFDPTTLCRTPPSPPVVERLTNHWRWFAQKAPLDPRVTDDILFSRAILHTKLATAKDLALARADYRDLLARRTTDRGIVVTLGNLAETEMMLGDLDASITTYRRVLEIEQRKETYFGLAVALDRDEQGDEARTILRSLGPDAVSYLYERIRDQDVFYVPNGEAYYYLALGYEANGHFDEAIRLYDLFLKSGAYPGYAGRARANRDALAARPRRTK